MGQRAREVHTPILVIMKIISYLVLGCIDSCSEYGNGEGCVGVAVRTTAATVQFAWDGNGDVNAIECNLLDSVHGGRPHNELPHVKKSIKKHREKVDLILRVDLVRGCFYPV